MHYLWLMKERYIGIKKGGYKQFAPTNEGIIFERQEDGTYHSINHRTIIKVTEDQIKHDLSLNYLKEHI